MLQNALREDALTAVHGGYVLRVGLPWIRSMPLSSISGLAVTLDGEAVDGDLRVRLGERDVPPESLAGEDGWWFIQDRLVLLFPAGRLADDRGRHQPVAVDFQLMVPYLQGGPEGPLVLPFHLEAALRTSQPAVEGASLDVA